MGVLTLLNLIDLFACDSCTFLYVGFTSIKSFLKTTGDESGELDLETGKYTVKTLGVPSGHRESLTSRYQPMQALLSGLFWLEESCGPQVVPYLI